MKRPSDLPTGHFYCSWSDHHRRAEQRRTATSSTVDVGSIDRYLDTKKKQRKIHFNVPCCQQLVLATCVCGYSADGFDFLSSVPRQVPRCKSNGGRKVIRWPRGAGKSCFFGVSKSSWSITALRLRPNRRRLDGRRNFGQALHCVRVAYNASSLIFNRSPRSLLIVTIYYLLLISGFRFQQRSNKWSFIWELLIDYADFNGWKLDFFPSSSNLTNLRVHFHEKHENFGDIF